MSHLTCARSPWTRDRAMGSMPRTVDTAAAADKLAHSLRGVTFGTTTIVAASAEVRLDADDEWVVYLTIRLSDPSDTTWPYEDILRLRRDVVRRAGDTGVDMPLYVRLVPETDLPQAEEGDPRLFDV